MPPKVFCCFLLFSGIAVGLLPATNAHAQMNMPMAMDMGDPVPPEQLPPAEHIAGAGNARFAITATPEAQVWFVQGYNLLYDFWDYEASRAFEQGIRADAHCAMCYWGLYQAETFRHDQTKSYAKAALAKAVTLAGEVTPREKLYIQAADAHAAAILEAGSDDKAKFDKEIELLRTLVKENPTDTNARILLSDALGEGYDEHQEPKKGTKEKISLLQSVLKEEPDNSVANHLWIHAVEASSHPEQALHSAEILGSLAPASGHMVHMPGHIFYRTGDYARAQASFDASTATDEGYMRQQKVAIDNDWNYVHNLMYSIANLMEAGQLHNAVEVSAKLQGARGHLEDTLYPWSARDSVARLNPELPVALRTADWPRVLQLLHAADVAKNMPHMEFLASGLSEFAQGMQSVEAHHPEEAEQQALQFDANLWRMTQLINDQQATEAKAKAAEGNHAMSPDPLPKPLLSMLSIMSLELRASLLAAKNDIPGAEGLFAIARRQEKDLGYHEPPFYIRPVSENEAAAMMTAGKWSEARAASAQAAEERPNSGFALYGVAQATEKGGDTAATTTAYQQFLRAWKGADPDLPELQHAQQWVSAHTAVAMTGP